MKRHIYTLLIIACAWTIQFNAQTPYDSFSPETSRPMLGIEVNSMADTINRLLTANAMPATDNIRKWLSVDPLADKYPNISPYAYCGWNPIGFIDSDGRDIYTFDEDGSFLHKKVQEGVHYGVMLKNGEQDFRFDFADPINDPRAIDEGKINRAICVSDNHISQILIESGVFESQNKRNKYSFILNESNYSNIKGNGRMDYVATGLYNGPNISNYNNSLFITDTGGEKTAHNTYNFGNFLWGAGAAVLGVPYGAAFVGSHLNNFFNDPSSKWHFDSKDDQLSIKLGFQWQQRR